MFKALNNLRKRFLRPDAKRVKSLFGASWYPFFLAGVGATAFSKNAGWVAIAVGFFLVALGVIMFLVAASKEE